MHIGRNPRYLTQGWVKIAHLDKIRILKRTIFTLKKIIKN